MIMNKDLRPRNDRLCVWDALSSVVLVGTRIWLGLSWFRWQSVEAVWHGFRIVGRAKIGILEPQEAVPLDSNLPSGARFIAWHLRRLFRGMPTGPEGFLCYLSMSGQQPSAWNHLEHGPSAGRTTNTDSMCQEKKAEKSLLGLCWCINARKRGMHKKKHLRITNYSSQ